MYTRITTLLVLFIVSCTSLTAAELLPKVENVRVEGNRLLWDSLAEADGYNIYMDYRYLDSVRGKSTYELSEAGYYDVVAFDDAGRFGAQFDHYIQFVPQIESDVDVDIDYYTAIVRKTCHDVNAGESCIAVCPISLEQYGAIVYTKYLSGGACSTSDVGGVDATVTASTYKCTVSAFTEHVVAQGVCVIRSR